MGTRISLISGGASGLGLELADQLIRAGRKVMIIGRNSDKLKRAVARLEKTAGEDTVFSLPCNIGKQDDVSKVGKFLKDHDLDTEYLFNNAGKGLVTGTESSTSELIDSIFEANLKGMILLTTEILRITPPSQELTIVNIMSTSALIGRSQETIYCAAKFGARGYTEALRAELKGSKRNVIAVYPGGMKTDFWNMEGQNKDLSGFMDPAVVAEKIVSAVKASDRMLVTDITINRK